MKRFIYLILILVFLLILKAFYLDPYLSQHFGDNNQSREANESVEPAPGSNDVNNSTPPPRASSPATSHDKLPLDQLGDSIAEKLEDKIGKQ